MDLSHGVQMLGHLLEGSDGVHLPEHLDLSFGAQSHIVASL